MIHAAAPRNHCGQGERRSSSLVTTCTGAQTRNSSSRPAMRAAARAFRRTLLFLTIAVEGDAVELHAMVDEPETELLGNSLLQQFELVIDELDHVAGLHID